jgi:hypothetical protein
MGEIKLKYGVSYFGNRILKHIKTDMRELKQNGFDYVLHTYSEYDLKFREKTLKEIVKISKNEGLKVWVNPWGVGNVFGGEPFSDFASQNIFTSCQVLDDGKPTPIACPNSPEFSNYMDKWLHAVSEAKVDCILWDEPHFHEQGFLSSVVGRWGCRCKYCKSEYTKEYNSEMPLQETNEVKQFKHNSLKRFVEKLTIKSNNFGIKNTLYLTANMESENIKTVWKEYAKIKSIDVISTGPYWLWAKKDINMVSEYSKILFELSKTYKKESQIWIQGFNIATEKETEIREAIELSKSSGIKNIAVWGFEGCTQQSWISCENPQATWENIIDSINNN